MKKLYFIAILWLAISLNPAISQDSKNLTIDDAVIGQWTKFYPEYISQLKWRPKTNYLTRIADNELKQQSVKSSKLKTLLTIDELNKVVANSELDSLKRFPRYTWVSKDEIGFKSNGKDFIYNLKSKTIKTDFEYSEKANNITYSPNKNYYAFTEENNLFLQTKDNKTIQITNDSDKGIVNGQSVHRNEFGISGGIFWSPDESKIAFYKKDETMVSDYPLVDITARVAELKPTKYPMAGMTSEQVKLCVFDINTQKTIELKTGEPKEQYLTNIAWTPDNSKILIAVLNRGQDHMKLNIYDAKSGNFLKTLFEEKHPKYVEPEHPAMFLPNSNTEFIWQSERDGFNHLYLYNTEGKLIKQISSGSFEITDIFGFDKKIKNIYLESTKESPIERHVYKLNIESGLMTKLTNEKGTHSANWDENFKYFIDVYSNTEKPRQYDIVTSSGKIVQMLLKAKNPYENIDLGEMSIFTIKADDNKTDLYCRMITPPDFDKTKKYPAIVYVYGGPHAQLVTDSWMGGVRLWQQYMAQKGYVMLTVDNRGSAHRGLEFENIIHRKLGKAEMADQMKGIEYLEKSGFVDMDRIGIHGWSYGGYMTTSLMVNYPEVFKVGVAGGPVIDWKYYEIMYGERYMDTPEENPEGYESTSLLNRTTDLKGKLLIIHGGIDPTVVPQHSKDFLYHCIKNKVQLDFFEYPMHEHNVRGYDRIHLMDKVSIYFDDFLK